MNDYKKAVAAAIISAGFIFSSVFGTSAAAASQGTVSGSGVRLRSKPSTSSSILTHAYKGDKVTVKDKSGNWYNVVFKGKTGWMSADYIKISSGSTAIASRGNTATAPGWITANSGLILRKSPSTSGARITVMPKGSQVTISSEKNGWSQVKYGNYSGWASSKYITKTKPASKATSSSGSTAIASRSNTATAPGWITANSGLILRKSPSTSSARITVMPKGSQVTISSEKNGWSQVKYGNYSGWASSKYITKTKPASKAASSSRSSSISSQIVALAKQQLGKPYVYGAAGPKAFDCSGLTYYVYKKFGYSIPRTSNGQGFGNYAPTVSKSDLQPGDLIVFKSSGSGYHMGIYIGGNQFIHSPNPGRRVSVNSLNESWYKSHYIQAKRIVR